MLVGIPPTLRGKWPRMLASWPRCGFVAPFRSVQFLVTSSDFQFHNMLQHSNSTDQWLLFRLIPCDQRKMLMRRISVRRSQSYSNFRRNPFRFSDFVCVVRWSVLQTWIPGRFGQQAKKQESQSESIWVLCGPRPDYQFMEYPENRSWCLALSDLVKSTDM